MSPSEFLKLSRIYKSGGKKGEQYELNGEQNLFTILVFFHSGGRGGGGGRRGERHNERLRGQPAAERDPAGGAQVRHQRPLPPVARVLGQRQEPHGDGAAVLAEVADQGAAQLDVRDPPECDL